MRIVVAAALAAVACWAAGDARAELVVSGPGSALSETGATAIAFEPSTPAARVVVLAPPGFAAAFSEVGTEIGRGSAALQIAGSPTEAAGALVAVDPVVAACGVGNHEAVWRLGGGPEIHVAVDTVASSDAEAAYASYRLDVCPAAGTVIASLELQLDHVFTSPSQPGDYAWRAVAVPGDSAGVPVPDAAVESRSTQPLPVHLALHGSFDRVSGQAILSGALSAAGRPVPGIDVTLAAGRSGSSLVRAGTESTGEQGRFRAKRAVVRTTVFEASVEAPVRDDPGGCPDPIAPGGCVSATLAPVNVTSDRVTVRAPAPRVLRLGSRGADVRRLKTELGRLHFLPPGSRGARYDERAWHAVVAFQGWRGLPRSGIVDRRTWRALATARTPAPWARLKHGVLIDTGRQVLLLVEGGRTVRAIHVSTGAYGRTPRGRFSVYRKETLSWSVPFGVWMPYASYFSGGFAMHAYSSVPSYPASHGCVRVPPVEAPGVYRFAGYGTPVWIR